MRTPESIERQLARFGRDFMYDKPLFRLMWSETILAWDAGDMRPRYPGRNCWVLMRYRGPEYYAPRSSWENTRDWDPGSPTFGECLLGPFPSRGDYEPMYFFTELREAGCGSLIPQEVVNLICQLVIKSGEYTLGERKAAMAAARAKSEADWQKFFDDYCDDKLKNLLVNKEFSSGGKRLRHATPKRRESDVKLRADLPLWLPSQGFHQCTPEIRDRLIAKQGTGDRPQVTG